MTQLLTNLQKNYIYRLLKGEYRLDTNIRGYLNGTDIPFHDALYAVTDEFFSPNSQQLLYTSGILHKIESYGQAIDALIFVQNRFNELSKSGLWINSDTICPENAEEIVFMWLNDKDGSNDENAQIHQASTLKKFKRFVNEFRKKENEQFIQEIVEIENQNFSCLTLREACEFALKLDKMENWAIEKHEKCCNFSFTDLTNTLQNTGFKVLPQSKIYKNDTFINHLKEKISLYDENFESIDFPEIHTMVIAEKG